MGENRQSELCCFGEVPSHGGDVGRISAQLLSVRFGYEKAGDGGDVVAFPYDLKIFRENSSCLGGIRRVKEGAMIHVLLRVS